MRKVLFTSGVIAVALVATISAQVPAAFDPLAIGGKDTDWFMSRVGRPDVDSEPQAPFKIMGNVYYVGSNNISSILVATPQGHILLDTGTQKMAAVVFPNIVSLGFKPGDIKVMLISHAHYDHMETMETIRRLTGATVAAMEAEVPSLVSGHDMGPNETWGHEPVEVGRVLQTGEEIHLGGSTIKAIWTPGHTLGATAYFITTEEGGETYQIVYGGPPGAVTGNLRYDTNPKDALASYAALREMNPDIRINGHPQNLFAGKLDALWAGERPSPLMLAPGVWTKTIGDSEAAYRERLAALAP
jgi:metallo-beta-lactamase class B